MNTAAFAASMFHWLLSIASFMAYGFTADPWALSAGLTNGFAALVWLHEADR